MQFTCAFRFPIFLSVGPAFQHKANDMLGILFSILRDFLGVDGVDTGPPGHVTERQHLVVRPANIVTKKRNAPIKKTIRKQRSGQFEAMVYKGTKKAWSIHCGAFVIRLQKHTDSITVKTSPQNLARMQKVVSDILDNQGSEF